MLSGNSLHNKDWIAKAENQLKAPFETTYVQDYAHWHNDQPNIDLAVELAALKATADVLGQPYGIFAKSIGSVLAVQAIEKGYIQPAFVLIMGVPLRSVLKDYPQYVDVLAGTKMPLRIIQNDHDPVGTSTEVLAYFGDKFEGRGAFAFTETIGDTHDYEDYDLLANKLKKLTRLV